MGLSTVPASDRLVESPSEPHHVSSTVYGSSIASEGLPRFEMGENEMEPRLVQRFIEDELLGDANPSVSPSFCIPFVRDRSDNSDDDLAAQSRFVRDDVHGERSGGAHAEVRECQSSRRRGVSFDC